VLHLRDDPGENPQSGSGRAILGDYPGTRPRPDVARATAPYPRGVSDNEGSIIEATALTLRYPGGVTALGDLTLAVRPGITGLVGANGAGKSTLIKILLGLLTPTSGTVRVFGLDTRERGEAIRARVGYMPEHDCLPADVTATEFVTHLGRMSGLPATAAKEQAAEALRHVGLHEERYRQIGTFSTGMKQRVKLAQALVGDPGLLLLDEPTNGLDPAGRDAMLTLIHRIGTEFGIAVVVASHLLSEIERICDHLVAIEGGRLLRAASLDSMTQALPWLAVEVDEGLDLLRARLTEQGLTVSPQLTRRQLLVRLDAEPVFDAVRDAVADLELPLSRLEHRRHHVEELVAEAQVGASAGEAEL
jgi:ABC-2 type transport system ATP-binding protein